MTQQFAGGSGGATAGTSTGVSVTAPVRTQTANGGTTSASASPAAVTAAKAAQAAFIDVNRRSQSFQFMGNAASITGYANSKIVRSGQITLIRFKKHRSNHDD